VKIERIIGGQAVIWSNDRRARLRAELALDMPWDRIAANIARSTAIQEQLFYSGFTYPDGRAVPEEEIDALAAADDAGMKALVRAISAERQTAPLEAAPSPRNSGNGAALASIPASSGHRKTGKSRKSSKAAGTTSARFINKA